MFLEVVDPVSGERTWRVSTENYDLAQEIARSAFADMLHDTERNILYKLALNDVITKLRETGKNVHVLDIGAGTGLLSMFAANAGADRVTALEVFTPMANCAKQVLKLNDFDQMVQLITARSTDLTEQSHGFEKGTVIVAEVFDTELIGEGALRTFKEALDSLAEPNTRVIPSSARVWIAPVDSDFLMKFTKPPGLSLRSPISSCAGTAAVFDLQLSEVPVDQIKLLCDPFVAFRFNFEDSSSITYEESCAIEFVVTAEKNSTFHAVLMWWDLDMDGTGRHILSTAPKWYNKKARWRDHWMQAVYYLPVAVPVKNGQTVTLHCSHDEFSMWFSVKNDQSLLENKPPFCSCKLHVICSRNAIFRMNEIDADNDFKKFLQQSCRDKSVICINEGSLIGLMAAQYAKNVSIIEKNAHFRSILLAYKKLNTVSNAQIFSDVNEMTSKEGDLIITEPFSLIALLPWHDLHYWFAIDRINKTLGSKLPSTLLKGILYAMPVQFEHLWKISAPVGSVHGFDLSPFDDICQKARSATDANVEPQPLWEYPSYATGEPLEIATFNLNEPPPELPLSFSSILLPSREGTNAIVFWMNWYHDGFTIKTGIVADPVIPGNRPNWSLSHKQGVYFLPQAHAQVIKKINIDVDFCPKEVQQLKFHFTLI